MWASLIVQFIKNPPTMQEALVAFLGWDDLLEKRIGYPLQYSRASQVAQLVKNPPAMRENWVRSLGWEDPLEKGMATHSSFCQENSTGMDRGAWWPTVHVVPKSWT